MSKDGDQIVEASSLAEEEKKEQPNVLAGFNW